MNKEFIPYAEALELKELGFDEPCLAVHVSKKQIVPAEDFVTNDELESEKHNDLLNLVDFEYEGSIEDFFKTEGKLCLTAPTFSQAFRWFREKHNLGHMINGIGFESFVMNVGGIVAIFNVKTYEEAELACLRKLIQLVKNE